MGEERICRFPSQLDKVELEEVFSEVHMRDHA